MVQGCCSEPSASRQHVVVHPQPLNKKRFHGSLLQGIMRNLEWSLRRYDFDALLVLSSRSWFRRPLTLREIGEERAHVPMGARRAALEYVALDSEGGGDSGGDDNANGNSRALPTATAAPSAAPVPHDARRAMSFVDVSGCGTSLELGQNASGGLVLSGYDWGPLRRTRLALEVLRPPCTLVKGS